MRTHRSRSPAPGNDWWQTRRRSDAREMDWVWGPPGQPQVYVGTIADIEMIDRIEAQGINLVIFALERVHSRYFGLLRGHHIDYLRIDPSPYMHPMPTAQKGISHRLKAIVADAVMPMMRKVQGDAGPGASRILICCNHGKHRSPFLAACLLMALSGNTVQRLTTQMQRERPVIGLGSRGGELQRILEDYEVTLWTIFYARVFCAGPAPPWRVG